MANDDWSFGSSTDVYRQVISLQYVSGKELLREEPGTAEMYIGSLAETLELVLTEDQTNLELYESRFQTRLKKLGSITSAAGQFTLAELHLHRAFVNLKFGHEFDAASELHEAYKLATKCRRRFPKFVPIRKTTGLLEIMIGSVPDKYAWVLSIVGMRGSVSKGIEDLNYVVNDNREFAVETKVLLALINGFVFQKPDVAIGDIDRLLHDNSGNRTLLLLGAVMSLKASTSEQALTYIDRLRSTTGLPLSFSSYLLGEIMLHKASYEKSISFYQEFLSTWKGTNYVKDANFKIGMCYYLSGSSTEQQKYFTLAREKGTNATEADRAAERVLAGDELPNALLCKVRYATDGGYYDLAEKIFTGLSNASLVTKHDQVEYFYRKARLEHKMMHLPAARLFYQQTIDLAADAQWYFAPNACLHLGYILAGENHQKEAKAMFRKALSYKHHEYKNSIDAKAKSALSDLEKK